MKSIVVFCAHSDDQILGAGGAMAKFAKKGYSVDTHIFSYGELSHPHYKKDYIKDIRIKESEEANKVIGGNKVEFFGLTDGQLNTEFNTKNIYSKIKSVLKETKPKIIFTHAIDDMLPDHRSVRRAVLRAYDELHKEEGFEAEVYSFDVWNIWNTKRDTPVLVVDISEEFKTKIKALHCFKSQINLFTHAYFVNILYLGVYIKGFLYGLRYKTKFAEVYHKLR